MMRRASLLLLWILLAAAVLGVDYATGAQIRFSMLFHFPVGLATWFSGRWAGAGLAVALPTARLALIQAFDALHAASADEWANTVIAVAALLVLVALLDVKQQRDAMQRELRVLRGLLPICSFCKKIRNDQQDWEPVEGYVAKRSEADFTHSVCPACAKQHYGVDISGN